MYKRFCFSYTGTCNIHVYLFLVLGIDPSISWSMGLAYSGLTYVPFNCHFVIHITGICYIKNIADLLWNTVTLIYWVPHLAQLKRFIYFISIKYNSIWLISSLSIPVLTLFFSSTPVVIWLILIFIGICGQRVEQK